MKVLSSSIFDGLPLNMDGKSVNPYGAPVNPYGDRVDLTTNSSTISTPRTIIDLQHGVSERLQYNIK